MKYPSNYFSNAIKQICIFHTDLLIFRKKNVIGSFANCIVAMCSSCIIGVFWPVHHTGYFDALYFFKDYFIEKKCLSVHTNLLPSKNLL